MRLLPFLLVSALVIVTPGVDMALVTRNAILHGRRSALATALGVNVGVAIWGAAAALGLARVISTSASLFAALKMGGAAYIAYLGFRALLRSRRSDRPCINAAAQLHLAYPVAFRQGVFSNVLNPKIAALFVGLLPQFAGSRGGVFDLLLLGGLFNVMGVVWPLSYAALVATGRAVFARPEIRRALERTSGVALIGLGLLTVLDATPRGK